MKKISKEKIQKILVIISLIICIGCVSYTAYTVVDEYISNKSIEDITAEPIENTNEWDTIKAKYPNVSFPQGMQLKWAETYVKNTDFVAYLNIPNTTISTPVVKKDNTFYLRHNFTKKYSRFGCAFLDFNDNIKPLSDTVLIYGHNMKNNKLFGQLPSLYSSYPEKKYQTLSFSTLYQDYSGTLCAAFYTKGISEKQKAAYQTFKKGYANEQEFYNYVKAINTLNRYNKKVDLEYGEKLIALYTCAYNHYDERFIVLFIINK